MPPAEELPPPPPPAAELAQDFAAASKIEKISKKFKKDVTKPTRMTQPVKLLITSTSTSKRLKISSVVQIRGRGASARRGGAGPSIGPLLDISAAALLSCSSSCGCGRRRRSHGRSGTSARKGAPKVGRKEIRRVGKVLVVVVVRHHLLVMTSLNSSITSHRS